VKQRKRSLLSRALDWRIPWLIRLREREAELEGATRRLLEKDRIKSQYVLTVSHDIRGPLSVIQEGYTGELSAKARELIERASARADALVAYVRDLLNLSRMRAAEDMEQKGLDFAALLSAAIEEARPLVAAKRFEVTVDNHAGDAYVRANEQGMQQVMANLLGNAIKYTPEGGRISLRLRGSAEDERISVTIADTGIGIPKEELPRIFEDFHRAPDGTGFGLSIVRHIVESHGSRIAVESEVGKGSSFRFSLARATRPTLGSMR
jgi:signal transduction histidine kinase